MDKLSRVAGALLQRGGQSRSTGAAGIVCHLGNSDTAVLLAQGFVSSQHAGIHKMDGGLVLRLEIGENPTKLRLLIEKVPVISAKTRADGFKIGASSLRSFLSHLELYHGLQLLLLHGSEMLSERGNIGLQILKLFGVLDLAAI